MITNRAIIRQAAERVSQAASRAIGDFDKGLIEQEPAFTDRMLGRIQEAMNGYESKGIRWSAKTLTDRGRGAQEARFGADFVGVFEASLPEYSTRKGFLAQAKLVRPHTRIPVAEFNRLQAQCDRMLSISPDSYVFLYSGDGISVLPASAVFGLTERSLDLIYSRSVGRFFEEHFSSFIGDRAISSPSIEILQRLRLDGIGRTIQYLTAVWIGDA